MSTHYCVRIRLDDAERWLLWFQNDTDGVITDANGQVPLFSGESRLREYAANVGVAVADEVPRLLDLDALGAWVSQPSDRLSCADHFNAWNLLHDVASSLGQQGKPFQEAESELLPLHEKLFWGCNLPAVTPAGQHFEPSWSSPELARLAHLFSLGLQVLRRAAVGVA